MTQLQDLVTDVQTIMYLTNDDIEKAVTSMITKTKKYVNDSHLQSLVIGVSGGLDSAVVSAILQEYNIGVPLIGISIPMSSSNDHKEQARWVGDKYCTAFEEFGGWDAVPYTELSQDYGDKPYEAIELILQQTHQLAGQAGFNNFPADILQGNIKARLRMMTLYDLARKTNGMVLSTDNLSEYLAGFWTINGDVGDWGIIQNVWKGFELPQIARYIGVREDIVAQKPSDGLSVTDDDTDEAQLGMTYQEFDTIISIHTEMLDINNVDVSDDIHKRLFDELWSIDTYSEDGKKVLAAVDRWNGTHYKRRGTINLSREDIELRGRLSGL